MSFNFVTLYLSLVSISQAYEIDQFTNRAITADDCTDLFDARVEQAMTSAITRANKLLIDNKLSCCPSGKDRAACLGQRSQEDTQLSEHSTVSNWWYNNRHTVADQTNQLAPIYPALNSALVFGNQYDLNSESTRTVFEDYASSGVDQRCRVPAPSTTKSIHKGSSWLTNIVQLEPEVIVNGKRIGVDKLGHFFAQGFLITKDRRLHDTDSTEAIYKNSQEDGLYGCGSTGLYSYGDMSANVAGSRFWNDVFYGENGSGENTYIACTDTGNGTFRYARTERPFTFKEYVTDAWDEGINCTLTCKQGGAPNYGLVPDKNFQSTCPLEQDKCLALGKAVHDGKLRDLEVSRVCRTLYSTSSAAPSTPSSKTKSR